MRAERFDHLVKDLAARHTRRRFLAGAAVAVSGIPTGFSPSFTSPASAGACFDDAASPICPGAIDHAAIAIRLLNALDPAHPGCLAGDASCRRDETCCSGICTMHGRCACFDAGHLCPSDGYCCGGVCRNGRCA